MAVEILQAKPPANAETQKPVMYGTGVLLINAAGEIVVAEQKFGKTPSGREAGQDSIPLETAKGITGPDNSLLRNPTEILRTAKIALESPEMTLLGAMAEVVNDSTLAKVGTNSFHTVSSEHYLASETSPGVVAKVETVFYSGDIDTQFASAHPEEIGKVRWVNPYNFLAEEDSKSRPLAKEIVVFALENNLINQTIADYGSGNSLPVFPEGFSINTAHEERENHTDINKIYTS